MPHLARQNWEDFDRAIEENAEVHNGGGTEFVIQELKNNPLIHWAIEPEYVGKDRRWDIRDGEERGGGGSLMPTRRVAEADVSWQKVLFQRLKDAGIRQVPYVPDAGHSQVIEHAHQDPDMIAYPLTTEEEGVAAVAGAWLGGDRAALLMQSSGVGNCVNMFSLLVNCRFPFLTIVTMRGEQAEFNPWQVPMGRATPAVLELMGISVRRVDHEAEVGTVMDGAIDDAFLSDQRVAVVLSQSLLGRKQWTK
jgi:sulfopyruvate decarboxylase alpha subunit